MVRLTKIYTRGGDRGKTSLTGGLRVDKHNIRVEAYGSVDETNAFIALIALYEPKTKQIIQHIQQDLFDLGADLSTPIQAQDNQGKALRITQKQIDYLEKTIDHINSKLEPLTSFILPGGSAASTYCHIARTVARRAERQISRLAARQKINPLCLIYINRLSDLLFVMGRYWDNNDTGEILWEAGKHT